MGSVCRPVVSGSAFGQRARISRRRSTNSWSKKPVPAGSTVTNAAVIPGSGFHSSPASSTPPETTGLSPAAPRMQVPLSFDRSSIVSPRKWVPVPVLSAWSPRLPVSRLPICDRGAARRRSRGGGGGGGGDATGGAVPPRQPQRGGDGPDRRGDDPSAAAVIAADRVDDDLVLPAGKRVGPDRRGGAALGGPGGVAEHPELQPVVDLGQRAHRRDGARALQRELLIPQSVATSAPSGTDDDALDFGGGSGPGPGPGPGDGCGDGGAGGPLPGRRKATRSAFGTALPMPSPSG